MADYTNVLNKAAALEYGTAFAPYTGVRLWYDDENAFFAGNETGSVLEADCPWATQAMANNILANVSGYVYQPFEASDVLLDPAAELGDGVGVGNLFAPLATINRTLDSLAAAEIGAPEEEEVEYEFPYVSPTQRSLQRKVTLGADYYGTRITRANGLEIVKSAADGTEKSRAKLNADELSFYDDNGGQALYFDPEKKRYAFKGDVEITGNIKMAAGNITWTDGGISSGISSEQVNTIITSRLVSSPTIAGGLFYGRDADGSVGDTWLEIGTEGGPIAGGWGLMLKTYGLDPIFGVFNGSFLSTAFYAKGFNFFNIDADTETVTPYGTWDFEDATVKGFSRLENLDGNIELSAGNGLVSVNLDPDARQIRFWFGPGNPVWALDASGLHAL